MDLHFGLDHHVYKSGLALGHLDDLFDQTGANLLLDLLDPVQTVSMCLFAPAWCSSPGSEGYVLVGGQRRLRLPLDGHSLLE